MKLKRLDPQVCPLTHTDTQTQTQAQLAMKRHVNVACLRCVGVCCDFCKSVYLDSNTSTQILVFVSVSLAH